MCVQATAKRRRSQHRLKDRRVPISRKVQGRAKLIAQQANRSGGKG